MHTIELQFLFLIHFVFLTERDKDKTHIEEPYQENFRVPLTKRKPCHRMNEESIPEVFKFHLHCIKLLLIIKYSKNKSS